MAQGEDKGMNEAPIVVYFAYMFSSNPTENTKKARDMVIKLMKKHPEWFVICPHIAIDVLLDGTLDWTGMGSKDFSRWRRTQAGMMSLAFLSKSDIMVLGCEPSYGGSSGVTWEHIFANVLNRSWRKDNPIIIMTYEEAMK